MTSIHARKPVASTVSTSPLASTFTPIRFKLGQHLLITSIQLSFSFLFLFYLPPTPLLLNPEASLLTTVTLLSALQIVIEGWRWSVFLDGGHRLTTSTKDKDNPDFRDNGDDDISTKQSSTWLEKVQYMIKRRQSYFVIAIGVTLFGTFMFYFIAILFGAPLYDKVLSTLLFSSYVSLLAIFPPACVLRGNTRVWARVFSDNRPETIPEKMVYYPTVSTAIGAWLGAIVIPLDWDRPWQVWPIPCVIGAFLGHASGSLIALAVCFLGPDSAAQRKRDE